MKQPSQKQRILDYLKSGKVLTRLNAWDELGILEAPARLTELRQDGHNIETKMMRVSNRYGEIAWVATWRLLQSTTE